MPATENAAPGFALSDFTNIPNPPKDDSPMGRVPAAEPGKMPTITEPEIKELVKEDEPPPPPPKEEKEEPKEETDEEPSESLEQAMRNRPEKKPKEEPAEKPDEAAAQEKAKEEASKAPERDADLKHELHPNANPRTKKTFTELQNKAKAARDERDAIIAEREALKKERDELTAKLKEKPAPEIPKEVMEEVKTLRERVRELDITKDPEIEAKYDKRMAANNDAIVAVLKSQGYGMAKKEGSEEMVENPKAVADLLKSGMTYENLHPLLTKLKGAGLDAQARQIERLIDKNETIAEERQAEIDSWKGNYDQRNAQRVAATKEQQEKQSQAFRIQTETMLKADVDALAKDFTFIKEPPAPLPGDAPNVAKAKQTAVDEYRAAEAQIQEVVKSFNPQGVTPDKLPEVVGRINSAAIQSVILKTHVLPKLKQELAAAQARIREQESELNKIRGAGKLSRLQGATPDDGSNAGRQEHASLEDAFKMARP